MTETLALSGLDLEVLRRGRSGAGGRTILLVHGVNPVNPKAPFLDLLAEHGEIVAPSHPGFGRSPRPDDFDTMYDLVHLYLELLDLLPGKVVMIGFSFGGWIAAEVAASGSPKLDRLVLVDPVGIKLGGREERDIVHFFNTAPTELGRLAWHDPSNRPAGVYGLGWQARIDEAMSDAEMIALARNWDALCLYAWRPHMYNPQLKHWLRRIAVPTLVLWGASDRVVTPEYGRTYSGLIPGARFAAIEAAGHHPELEQPHAFVEQVARFLGATGMMFIIRSGGERPEAAGIQIKLRRETPATVADAKGKTDFFCVGETEAMAALRAAGWTIVELHDGYYEDGLGGGVGIWGQGKYWEIRDTPFTVREAATPTGEAETRTTEGEQVNVRGAIFGV